MAPALRRLPAALFVALLTALVFGAVVGVASASDGSSAASNALQIPMPAIGDRWTYQALLGGSWNFGPNDHYGTDAPFTYAEFSWLDPVLMRGDNGTEVAVDRLSTKGLEYKVDDKYGYYGGSLWVPKETTYAFQLGTAKPVAWETDDQSAEPVNGGSGVGPTNLGLGTSKQVEGRVRFLGGKDAPCMARTSLQGTAIALDHDIQLSACLPLVGIGFGEPGFAGFDFSALAAQFGGDGGDGGPGAYKVAGAETVAGYSTVRFDGPGGSIWLSAQVPVPVQMQGAAAGAAATLTLSSFHPGTTPLGTVGPLPGRPPAPEIVLAPRQVWGPDDSGVDHPFPASAAFKGALSDPTFPNLRDWMRQHPKGLTFMLEYHEEMTDTPPHRSWLFHLTDGSATTGFSATQTDLPGPLPDPVRYRDESYLAGQFGMLSPTPEGAPRLLPTVASVLARWQAYEATEGRGTLPNGWGMILSCFVGCAYNYGEVVAGRDPVTWWNYDPATAARPASIPAVPQLGNRSFEGSQLDVRQDGDSMNLRHWTGYATTGPDLGPLTSQTPVDPAATPRQGGGHTALATFLPTPGQAGAVSLAATLVGLLYWIWPSLKGGSFLGLFSRLQGSQLLAHPSRARLMQVIQSEPGIHFQDLVRRSGLPNGTAVHHVRKLEQAGLVAARSLGRYTCYFPGTPERAALAAAPVTRSDGARRIMAEVAANPGVSGSEVAVRLGLQPSTVAYHVKRLEQAGLMSAVRDGRMVRLRTSSPA